MLRRRRTVIVGLMTTACVHANGIDIYYAEAGEGEPLLLLDNAMVSTNPVWAAIPFAYASFLGTLAEHFRVIAPDTRGSGKSVHPGGPIPAALLADDVAALIEALNLDRPLICGFSDGGETATLVGIRYPGSVRAIVNHGGYAMFELMKADHDRAQGAGHWKTVIARTFDRVTQPHGYTVENLKAITVPALILTGDRDPFCTIEAGAAACRALPAGALAVLPDTGHLITPAAVRATIEFFECLDH
jgi:pimeloyl-ACP methyl ester carboxylesterase